jgi:uncharacterized protein (DUF433 family)
LKECDDWRSLKEGKWSWIGENTFVATPNVLCGKPVIAGTRISVELILEKLASGQTIEQILEDYPHLTEEAIRAAIAFAAEVLKTDVIYPLPAEVKR